MLRSITAPLAAAILATALSPSAAGAQACAGRPGASAIEQYCEAIPDGDGDRVTGTGTGPSATSGSRGSAGAASGSVNLPSGTAGTLRAAGPAGKAVLGLVARESSASGERPSKATNGTATTPGSSTTSIAPAKTPSDNPLRAVSSAATDGATVGSMFLWGLLALAVAALAAGWIGFRRNRGS